MYGHSHTASVFMKDIALQENGGALLSDYKLMPKQQREIILNDWAQDRTTAALDLADAMIESWSADTSMALDAVNDLLKLQGTTSMKTDWGNMSHNCQENIAQNWLKQGPAPGDIPLSTDYLYTLIKDAPKSCYPVNPPGPHHHHHHNDNDMYYILIAALLAGGAYLLLK